MCSTVPLPVLLPLLALALAAHLPRAEAWWKRPTSNFPTTSVNVRLVAANYSAAEYNSRLLESSVHAAAPGTRLRVPAGFYWIVGGTTFQDAADVELMIDGTLRAVDACYDSCWPAPDGRQFSHILHFINATRVNITSSGPGALGGTSPLTSVGLIDGSGKGWWNKYVIGNHSKSPRRPKLVVFERSTDLLIENITLLNSPSFNLQFSGVVRVEVNNVRIHTDRNEVRRLKEARARRRRRLFSPLQPEDLNTDGIDPQGRDVWIHDTIIVNDDDSIAVKPSSGKDFVSCSENMLMENMVLTGFGASIGSVPPNRYHHCVRNITFRNISMPGTGKGVYVKSNPTCDGDPNNTAEITNIVYEDIVMHKPLWWAIWIGPQQQQEPGSALGRKCALQYPLGPCPTQGCVTFTNITLRRINITDPVLSPGVILGNSSNPMQGIVFEDVVVTNAGSWPYKQNYQCKHALGKANGTTTPVPPCFT